MKQRIDVQSFAEKCGLDVSKWDALGDVDQSNIIAIYKDYVSRHDELSSFAVSLSSFIQKIAGVHSVRWRVKDPYHLVRKICRKKEKKVDKYSCISVENYRTIITDLIGVRALHLFKGDFAGIHSSIIEMWNLVEEPVAYVRKGDADALRQLYRELNLIVQEHSD